jgi:hypothetical protein
MEPNRTQPTQNQYEKPKSKAGMWTAVGVIIVAVIIVLIYFATQKSITKNTADQMGNDAITNTPTSGNGTVLGASERVAVTPTITGLDVTNLGTFPYKVQARVKASVPTACSELDTPTVVLSGKTFTITATASAPKDGVCAQVITAKEKTMDIPVAGLAAGKYTVKLGAFTKTFTLASNNEIEYTSDK